jgi:fatty-acyl-CoA synthase
MFIAELAHPDFDQFDLSTLRTGLMAGSPCPVEIIKQVMTRMNLHDIVIGYGMTELSPACTMTTPSDPFEKRVATVGRAFPQVECKIVDSLTGRIVPSGTPGEVLARGYNVMLG